MLNALSVDVEEYFHAEIFRSGTGTAGPAGTLREPRRGERRPAARRCSRHGGAQGHVLHARRNRRGPPVGGAQHRGARATRSPVTATGTSACTACRPRNSGADIRRAKSGSRISSATPVIGYRAPNFSIGPRQSWAYEILMEEGFRYDSSTFPILHDRYGRPGAPRFPVRRSAAAASPGSPSSRSARRASSASTCRSAAAATSGCRPTS